MSPRNIAAKKTIYIDVDEEITGIIDKVRSANESIIALVVPKRAAVFSSIVNLKLLKRAADQSKKRIVLITSNQSVLPLAGIVGLHAAANLNSKPYLPKTPETVDTSEAQPEEEPIEIDPAAAASAAVAGTALAEEVPSIEVDNKPKSSENGVRKVSAGAAAAATAKVKGPKKQKFKVPNFNRFRMILIAGIVALLVLVAGGYWALAIAPKASVKLKGETDTKSLSFKVVADTSAKEANQEGGVVPSLSKVIKKTETEKVPTTGQKDKGNKATGTVTLQNCSQSDGSVNIPAGTGISSGDLTFITQDAVFLDPSIFTGTGKCVSDTKEVDVIAQQGGEKYNVDKKNYTVAGFSGVRAQGSEMKGGTTDVVKVVSSSDIENAKQKLGDKSAAARAELKAALNADGYLPLEDTYNSAAGAYVPTPAVDAEASEVGVSVEMTYTMLGLKKDDLKSLVKYRAEKDAGVDTTKQSILDDGLAKASFQLGGTNGSNTDVTVNTNIIAGPEFDQDAIKKEIAGMKRGVAEEKLKQRPGVKEVTIDTKPFWNYSVPKNIKKITITIEDSDGQAVNP